MENHIKTGIGVMIKDGNKILLGHRVKNAIDTGGIYEPDSWTLPGGKQEYDETMIETAIRETKEETNLDVSDVSIFTAFDDFGPNKHYVTIQCIAGSYKGELKVMEPDKIDEWRFFDLNELPDVIYSPSRKFIEEYLRRREEN